MEVYMYALTQIDKTNAVIWFVIGGFCTLCIPGSNFYWAAAAGVVTALLNIYVTLFIPERITEYDEEFRITSTEKISVTIFNAVNPFYWLSGMMYLSDKTERYMPIRPGDVFALMSGVKVFIMYSMPILNLGWLMLRLCDLMPLSLWWLFAGNAILFLLPPVYATLLSEYYLWQYNKSVLKS